MEAGASTADPGAQALAARVREVLLDGTWIANTNWQDQIRQTSWTDARRPVASLNSVFTLTVHVHYYVAGILDYLRTGKLRISDQHSFDLPPMEGPQDWDQLRDRFAADGEAFVQAVAGLSAEALDAVFVDPRYGDCRRNIDGLIEHSYYHLGQVVLIRKLLAETAAS